MTKKSDYCELKNPIIGYYFCTKCDQKFSTIWMLENYSTCCAYYGSPNLEKYLCTECLNDVLNGKNSPRSYE